ncbi:MAG: methylmalonyl-CoA mutase cobalamin-binding subunit [Gammaproteobacteria bacterium]|jgi:methylmalonyl-CoA mutase cobalamin-binding subunit
MNETHHEELTKLAEETRFDSRGLRESMRELASGITIGRSAFLEKVGAISELEYKQQSMRDGHVMYHAHIGMNDMSATSAALGKIHSVLDSRGFIMDRAGFAVDRRMGLPSDYWNRTAAETGPMLESIHDWEALAQSAPIQPHMGDFMIGQPASVESAIRSLEIGATTVGNLSQFFTFEAPGWTDTKATSLETAKAMMLLGEFRDQGVMLHSYLEDGFGALFKYCETVAAWAMFERYIVEELTGARLTHCIGGLTSDPVKRAGWVLALQKIHLGDLVGSMIYGDTISFGPDFEKNRAVTSEYLLWDILIQLHSPSGHAVLPLPVTEAIRIPSADEIIEAQLFGRQVEQSARRLYPHINFSGPEAFATRVVEHGERIFNDALNGIKSLGVDVRNPVQLLYFLKKLGPQRFESLFASSLRPETAISTDMYQLSLSVIEQYRPVFNNPLNKKQVANLKLLLASTDVHEHAIGALAQLLDESGAEVTCLGAEQSPDQIFQCLQTEAFDAVLLSTHNGMALDYARQLTGLIDNQFPDTKLIMGGVLNQKVENQALPVAVENELKTLGIIPVGQLPLLPGLLANSSRHLLGSN